MIANANIYVLPVAAVPIVLTVMAHFRWISSDWLARQRRYATFGCFAVAAIFAPPDAFSPLVVALALVGLYEISIWCTRAA